MESLWKVLETATGIDELHQLALDAKDELASLKDRVDELEKKIEGEGYTPKEYPKMTVSGKTVWNADEEAKESGVITVPSIPVGEVNVTEASTNADESTEVEPVHE